MKKFIANYKELRTDENVSLMEHISDIQIENKETILEYLKRGTFNGVRCSSVYDYVSDEPIISEGTTLFTDGEYYWDSEEIYHFEKYNMELNKEFLKKFEE